MSSSTPDDFPIVHEQSRALLHLRGTVNIYSARALHGAALSLSGCGVDVVICCDQAEYLDVSALQVLLSLRADLRKQGRSFSLEGVRPPLAETLRLAGVEAALCGPSA